MGFRKQARRGRWAPSPASSAGRAELRVEAVGTPELHGVVQRVLERRHVEGLLQKAGEVELVEVRRKRLHLDAADQDDLGVRGVAREPAGDFRTRTAVEL